MERRRIFRQEARQKESPGLTQERRKQKWREVDGSKEHLGRGITRT